MTEQQDPRKGFQNLHTLVWAARELAFDSHDTNPEYTRALVELIANTTGHGSDEKRAIVERLVLGEPREFEMRGTITIEYAMDFSEAEAVEWFPNVRWDDETASHADDIENLVRSHRAPKDFWDSVITKRQVVIDGELNHPQSLVPEVTGVVEL